MSTVYRIISEGYPIDGQAKNVVIERIAERFKMDIGKAARLVSGKAIALKSGLDQSAMKKYCRILESTGLKFKVESSQVDEPATNCENPAAGFACPKCGHENSGVLNDPEASCIKCGVLFKKVAAKAEVRDPLARQSLKEKKAEKEVRPDLRQEGIEIIRDEYNMLPGSLKSFWKVMVVVAAIALLMAIFEGGVGFILGVAFGVGIAWFYIPYSCMRTKGFWPWMFIIAWTFPFGLMLLSESAKAYFLSEDR